MPIKLLIRIKVLYLDTGVLQKNSNVQCGCFSSFQEMPDQVDGSERHHQLRIPDLISFS